MLRNYFRLAFRYHLRDKTHSLINMAGLGLFISGLGNPVNSLRSE